MNAVRSFFAAIAGNPKLVRNVFLATLVLALPLTVFVAQQVQENRQQALTPTIMPSPTPNPNGPIYTISGTVYDDKNDDKLKQAGEGLANIPVKIIDADNELVVQLTTNAEGFYEAVVSDAGAYMISAGSVSGFEYLTTNPKLVTVKGACPTATPFPTSTPTAAPTDEPTTIPSPSASPQPSSTPSATPSPFLTAVPNDSENASGSGDVQGVQSCGFQFTVDFILKAKPSATAIPTPTLDACRAGLTRINVSSYCGNNSYRYVDFECANGATGKLGGETSCKTMDSWYGYARNSCLKQSSCSITPTRRPSATPSATLAPSATVVPSATTKPTATATPRPTATPIPFQACDINGNGKVGEEDFTKMINCLRKDNCSSRDKTRADLNKDGSVSYTDLNLFFRQCRRF